MSDAAGPRASASSQRPGGGAPKVAFIVSRFPKISETFILYEILALERHGLTAEVYALRRERQPVAHPEAMAMLPRVHFRPFVSPAVAWANAWYLVRRPGAYLRLIAEVVGGTFRSRRMFVAAVAYLPKAVRFAYDMERSGVTHVHAHFATHPTLAALIIHRLTGIPFSFTAHGSDLHVDRRMLDVKMRAAAFAVTVSHFNKALMVETAGGGEATTHVINPGVELDLFARPEETTSDTTTRDGPRRIISVASFEEVKGHRFLVEACERLAQRKVDFHVDLVGDGPLRGRVAAQVAAAGLRDRFTFHGMKARTEVAELLHRADIKVLASYPSADGKREGMPNVLVEAMAAGLPVVATRLTGIPELVNDEVTGLLVNPADADDLARALERLCIDAELRRAMGRAGRQRAVAGYDRTQNALALGRLFGMRIDAEGTGT